MTPLIPQKTLFAFLFGALALALAAPAGARPILADSELGDAPATVVPAKPDLEHSVLAKGAVAVVPDAVDRAVAAQAPSDSGTVVLRKSGTVVVVRDQGTTGEPAWLRALNARSEAMNEYYAGQNVKPAWLRALEARSEAMNEYYGAGTSAAVRPDDRANPRPVDTRTVVQVSGSTSSTDNGIAWGDVAAGALGGFGIALLIGLGGFAVLHSHRRTGTIAH